MAAAPITLSEPSDVLAMVPNLFGFAPEDSLVILGVGPGGFHARMDHPSGGAEAEAAAIVLADAFVRNRGRVTAAVVVCYTDRAEDAALALAALRERVAVVDVEVVASMRAHGGRWYCLTAGGGACDHPGPCAREGTAYDPSSHPIAAVWVAQGHASPLARRSDMAETMQADPGSTLTVEAVAGAEADLDAALHGAEHGDGHGEGYSATEPIRERGRWVAEQVETFTTLGMRLSDAEAAQMVAAMGHPDLCDVAWASMRRETAREHLALWADLTRRTPREAVAPVAGLAAFAAWLTGNGALAWCAVDRCHGADPSHVLGRVVTTALQRAIPPATWTPPALDTLPLFDPASATSGTVREE